MVRTIKKSLLLSVLALMIIGGWALFQLLRPAAASEREVGFSVASGQGVNAISANLRRAGLIRSSLVFETYIWALQSESKIIAGRYKLNTAMNIPQISEVLLGGSVVQKDRLTLIEGWNRSDNAAYLSQQGFNGSEYLQLTASPASWRDDFPLTQAIPANGSLEGWLFPDTYEVSAETKTATIIERQLQTLENKISDRMIADMRLQGKTLLQVMIMASIVEKEVPAQADKKMIADIFWKRLKADIGLQSDATINFITAKGTTRPSLDDLKVNSLYNTYKYKGLPPGPISNPGLASIEAALYPTPNPYYYFLTDKDGAVHYARNLEEHKRNRELYLGQ